MTPDEGSSDVSKLGRVGVEFQVKIERRDGVHFSLRVCIQFNDRLRVEQSIMSVAIVLLRQKKLLLPLYWSI